MGNVSTLYRAKDRRLGITVAVKVLHPEHNQNADFMRRFMQEARLGSQVRHPNLVPAFDFAGLGMRRFIVFEGEARLSAGAKIAEVFKQNRPEATPDQVEMEEKRLARAPLVIAVVSRAGAHVKIPEWEQVLSAGAAATSLVFAAHAMGFAASWLTEWYAYDRRVLDALGLAPNERIAGFVHIGRPVKSTEDRPRPALSEIVTRYDAN